jgi:four helix bundle protein
VQKARQQLARLAFGVRRWAFGAGLILFVYNTYIICFDCRMNDFTEFDAFQRCRDFARAVAEPLNARVFSRDPVLVTQLRKTLLSIYSNFAEGFERDGNREFSQFVSITKGSVGEARGQLLYAVDFRYLDIERFQELNALGQRAGECLGGLMRFLNTTELRGRKFKRRTPNR